jgi:hypothetical protein
MAGLTREIQGRLDSPPLTITNMKSTAGNFDNVSLYWLTNTAVSSARLYWESKLAFLPRRV